MSRWGITHCGIAQLGAQLQTPSVQGSPCQQMCQTDEQPAVRLLPSSSPVALRAGPLRLGVPVNSAWPPNGLGLTDLLAR